MYFHTLFQPFMYAHRPHTPHRHAQATQEDIKLHRHLHHKNIVQYYGATTENGVLKIFLEFVPGGESIHHPAVKPTLSISL